MSGLNLKTFLTKYFSLPYTRNDVITKIFVIIIIIIIIIIKIIIIIIIILYNESKNG